MANPTNPNGSGSIVPYVNTVYALPSLGADGSYGDGVEYTLKELANAFGKYQKVEDCIDGSEAVKGRTTSYLPNPDPNAQYAKERYDAYVLRAVFYAVTRRTLNGLIGQVFLRDPLVKLPSSIAVMEKDADGSGLSLNQLSKKAQEFVLCFGRAGLLADFPSMERQVTRAEIQNGTIRPTLCLYHPRDVRNWRTVSFNGRQLLSLVVISESYIKDENSFKPVYDIQFRVLRITPVLTYANGAVLKYQYSVEIWRKEGASNKYILYSTAYPKDSKGLSLEEIPFTFIGSEDNSPSVDYPPLYDLADINLAHYRNSADYEESSFIIGQPTPWASGIDEHWATEVLKGEIQIGSRAVLLLPVGGSCGLLQASENGMIKEAMESKERQMVALGAKLVEQREVQRTAKEAGQEAASEASVLAASAQNVSNAFKWCLEWAAIFAGEVSTNGDATSKAVEYKLNTEYELAKLSPEELKGVISTWQQGGLTDEEFRTILTKAGMATAPFADWKKEKETKEAEEIAQLEAQSELNNPNRNTGDE